MKLKSYIFNFSIIFILLLLLACSSETDKQSSDLDTSIVVNSNSLYDSWNRSQFENITIIYPSDHPFSDKMDDYAKIYKTVLRRNAQFFGLEEPSEKIEMLYYTGFGQGQEMAVSEFPTVRNDSIFYWSGNKFGVTAAMYLLHKWTKVETKHAILFNGIMRLLDASGRDYHAMTLAFIDSSKFISLLEVNAHERLDYKWEAYQSSEAASFVDYFVFKYGIDNFKLLYESELSFEESIQKICKINVTILQKNWLKVISQVVKNNKD